MCLLLCYNESGDYMNEEALIKYYNKFNEEKRLKTKHGNIEFITALKYIHDYLKENNKIIDIGAGCGAYSIMLANEGYDVTAVELVKHNLRVIEQQSNKVKCYQGNAVDLSKFDDNCFDITLLFGPMYHLITYEEKKKALKEAERITKSGGYIFISYCMNEYAIITHGFKENFIKEELHKINSDYQIISNENDLYSYVRLEEINHLKNECNLERVKIIAQDGPTEYLKKEINNMDENTYELFMKYHFATCEREELLGASRHILDILKVS